MDVSAEDGGISAEYGRYKVGLLSGWGSPLMAWNRTIGITLCGLITNRPHPESLRERHADDLETSRGGPISIALPVYDPVIPLASSERARKMPDLLKLPRSRGL